MKEIKALKIKGWYCRSRALDVKKQVLEQIQGSIVNISNVTQKTLLMSVLRPYL